LVPNHFKEITTTNTSGLQRNFHQIMTLMVPARGKDKSKEPHTKEVKPDGL